MKLLKNGQPEKSYKTSPIPKIYVVKNIDADGRVTIYNHNGLVFDSQGNCLNLPLTIDGYPSNWTDSKLVKLEDLKNAKDCQK
ncbi:MAG: hypothetical protein VKJ02_13885 [Snowella sp.]|nr:hypothetical protein [Snowella sp.]